MFLVVISTRVKISTILIVLKIVKMTVVEMNLFTEWDKFNLMSSKMVILLNSFFEDEIFWICLSSNITNPILFPK